MRSIGWFTLGLWHVVMATLSCVALAQERPFTTDVVKSVPRGAPARAAVPDAVPESPWSQILPHMSTGRNAEGRVSVRRIEIRGDRRRTDVVLTLSGRTPLSSFALAGPDRIVIDGAGFDFSSVVEVLPRRRVLVGAPRMGPLDAATGRLLFDAIEPVRVVSATGKPTGDAVEVTVTIIAAGVATGRAVPPAHAPVLWGQAPAAAAGVPDLPTSTLPAPRQGAPVVVIDPGHGGIDPGAVADMGVLEKDVVLAVALRVKSLLDARGRVQVVMTRTGDQTVRLDQRVAIAGAQKADLFISLHADTFAGQGGAQVRGSSIYVLGAEATNATARALAEKENMADTRAGIAGGEADYAVDSILADLTLRETQALSQVMQGALVQSLRRSVLLAREPARAAAFRVLKQAETPAVLIELGYMSNSLDIALLQSEDWQASVAARIADAVDAYFAKSRAVALER